MSSAQRLEEPACETTGATPETLESESEQAEITAFVSIHDVAPDTLSQTAEILSLWETSRRNHGEEFSAELLVIPGLDWKSADLDQLKLWVDDGHQLVGHGWCHQSGPRKEVWHWIHSLCLSRNVAEHLSKSTPELAALMTNCFAWFCENGLPAPQLYVPPAWAMGRIKKEELDAIPFRFFENLFGYFDSKRNEFYRVPLAGFEADTRLRSVALRTFNHLNLSRSLRRRIPIRISIHPHDLSYRIAHQIKGLASSQNLQTLTAVDWLLDRQPDSELLF